MLLRVGAGSAVAVPVRCASQRGSALLPARAWVPGTKPRAAAQPMFGAAHPRRQVANNGLVAAMATPEPADIAAGQPPEMVKLSADCQLIRWLTWWSFWTQLALACVSGVILVFSVSARQGFPPPSTWLASAGVATALASTFLNYVYRKMANRIAAYDRNADPKALVQRLEFGSQINLAGMGATILALQAEVGSLLTKTLASSAANPYAAAQQGAAPVAFDVFTVQASTNTVMAHFASILFLNWMLRILNRRIRLVLAATS